MILLCCTAADVVLLLPLSFFDFEGTLRSNSPSMPTLSSQYMMTFGHVVCGPRFGTVGMGEVAAAAQAARRDRRIDTIVLAKCRRKSQTMWPARLCSKSEVWYGVLWEGAGARGGVNDGSRGGVRQGAQNVPPRAVGYCIPVGFLFVFFNGLRTALSPCRGHRVLRTRTLFEVTHVQNRCTAEERVKTIQQGSLSARCYARTTEHGGDIPSTPFVSFKATCLDIDGEFN